LYTKENVEKGGEEIKPDAAGAGEPAK